MPIAVRGSVPQINQLSVWRAGLPAGLPAVSMASDGIASTVAARYRMTLQILIMDYGR